MKNNWDIVASILNTGDVALYNISKPTADNGPYSILTGLDTEGFGLSWNNITSNHLGAASG